MKRNSTFEAIAPAAVRGVLCGFTADGEPLVEFPANESPGPIAGISAVPLAETDCGREVVLLFEDSDLTRPIVIGLRQARAPINSVSPPEGSKPLTVELDGERIAYTAKSEIVLRCGKASIQLLSDGSVRIRGTNVLSRASATNRIRGGNIQLN